MPDYPSNISRAQFALIQPDLTKNSGYDGGKKISGIKRHMAVDINGLPQAILVTRANVSDRSGALAMFI